MMNLRQLAALMILAGWCGAAAGGGPAVRDVQWAFSSDGGKTFAPAAGTEGEVVARASFQVDDPAQVAGLSVAPSGESAGVTRGDKAEWKCPVLFGAKITLNGKSAGAMPSDWIVYDNIPLDPRQLVKGANTLTLAGRLGLGGWAGHKTEHHSKPMAFVLDAYGAEKAAIQNGPVVGAFGEDFVTICCRTNGAGVCVKLTGRTDAGKELSAASEPGLYHRFRLAVPKDTRSVTYTLKVSPGDGPGASKGPYTIRLPDLAGGKLRFAAVGDTDGGPWKGISETIRKLDPDFVLHAGGMNYFPHLDGGWNGIFEMAAPLHAGTPVYAARGFRDFGSFEFTELFYRPSPDGKAENWTQVLGPVRLIGLGLEDWSAGSANVQWLETTLASAKEKFVIVLFHAAAFSSDQMAVPPLSGHRLQSREVVMPLLAKHHATLMLSADGHGYERAEPDAGKGVTQLVAGASGGTTKPRPSGRAAANNPFAKVYYGHLNYLWFQLDGDTLKLEARSPAGEVVDTQTFPARAARESRP